MFHLKVVLCSVTFGVQLVSLPSIRVITITKYQICDVLVLYTFLGIMNSHTRFVTLLVSRGVHA